MEKRMKFINLWFTLKKYRMKIVNSIKENIIIFLLFLILLIPFCLQLNMFGFSSWLKKIVRIGTPRDWLGFWGTYLGSILTILFAYLNTRYETGKQSNIQKNEEVNKSLETVKIALAKISFNSIFKIDTRINYGSSDNLSSIEKRSEEIFDNVLKILDLKTSLLDLNININLYEKYSKKLYNLTEELIIQIQHIYQNRERGYVLNIEIINKTFLNIKKYTKMLQKVVSGASTKNNNVM